MVAPITEIIETGNGRVIIGEHKDSAYLCIEGGAAFLTESQIVDAFAALRAIKKRVMLRRVSRQQGV